MYIFNRRVANHKLPPELQEWKECLEQEGSESITIINKWSRGTKVIGRVSKEEVGYTILVTCRLYCKYTELYWDVVAHELGHIANDVIHNRFGYHEGMCLIAEENEAWARAKMVRTIKYANHKMKYGDIYCTKKMCGMFNKTKPSDAYCL